MIAVLDASAALRVATGQDPDGRFRSAIESAALVLVPDLYAAEVTNALWKLVRHAGVDPDLATETLRICLALPDTMEPLADLAEEALSLACQQRRPAYDLFYLILARRHAAVLLTADQGLRTLAEQLGVRV